MTTLTNEFVDPILLPYFSEKNLRVLLDTDLLTYRNPYPFSIAFSTPRHHFFITHKSGSLPLTKVKDSDIAEVAKRWETMGVRPMCLGSSINSE